MIKTATELNIAVKNARLLTRKELNEHESSLPEISDCAWWLADVDIFDDDYIAYAEGNYTDEDMFCHKSESNTMLRVALDITSNSIEIGEPFEYRGYIFTVLSNNLAISNNFLGMAKYFDEEITEFIFSDEEITCTISAVIENMLMC